MNLLIGQIVFGAMIIGIGFLCFKYDKTKITTKDMVTISLLSVLAAIISKFVSIQIPPNSPVFVIGFAMSIMIVIGLLFSPKLCFIAGIVIDILGVIFGAMQGQSYVPFLGFTLGAILQCLLPSISIKYLKNKSPKFMNNSIIGVLVIFCIISYNFVYSRKTISIDQIKTTLTPETRFIFMLLVIGMSIAVVFITKFLQNKYKKDEKVVDINVITLTFIVLLVQIISSIVLTSLSLTIMYEIPFEVGASVRIIKDVIILPIDVIIVLTILKLIPNKYKIKETV